MHSLHSSKTMQRALSALLFVLFGWVLWRAAPEFYENPSITVAERVISSRGYFEQATRTNYASVINAVLTSRTAFIGARVDRTYNNVEHMRRTILGFSSSATIAVRYSVTYPIGFDLRSGYVTVTQDGNGLILTLSKPRLLSLPGIRFHSHKILDGGLFIDEDAQVIALQRRQLDQAVRRGKIIATDPAVRTLCERQLVAFVRALTSELGVDPPSHIRFVYH